MMEINKAKSLYNPFQAVSIAPLISFRIIFGLLLFIGTFRFLLKGWVNELYMMPDFFFGYLGFEWVKPLEEGFMYIPFILLLIASIGILLGFHYKKSALIAFLCFSYIELLDKTNYLNHYYFVSLILFLLIFVPANKGYSLDIKRNKVSSNDFTPRWTIDIFKFQLACVYFFAGIAKINSDWLFEAQPLAIWLQAHRDLPMVGQLLTHKITALLFSWTGCIYDLLIVFFLLSSKYRKFAYFFVVFFHLVTWYLFPIGVFPWVMIFSTLIFFSSHIHSEVLSKLFKTPIKSSTSKKFKSKKYIKIALVVYISLQLLLPFRYILYPGHLFWNEEGFRFSWRVMLMHKEGKAFFYIKDKKSGGEIEIDNTKFLSPTQEDQMTTQPDMILQYAHHLKSIYSDTVLIFGENKFELKDISVHAEIFVSLNGRPSQLFVSKKHDLSRLPYNLNHREWLEPFKK
jgi:hypothetical protein